MKRAAEEPLTSGQEKKAKLDHPLLFVQNKRSGYFHASRQSVWDTDGTLLITFNPHTLSEKLTRQLSIFYKKHKFEIRVNEQLVADKTAEDLQSWLKSKKVKRLNIAGNAMHRFPAPRIAQSDVDKYVYDLLATACAAQGIQKVQSTAESGIGEAGIKAAMALQIPAMVLAPQMWKWHDQRGYEQCDEECFKKRFDKQ